MEEATDYFYDADGRLTDVYQPAVTDEDPASPTYGESVRPHTTYLYDTAGNEIEQITAGEQAAYQAWISAGHSPASFTGGTAFGYDQNGNQVSQTLPGGQNESWTYNANNQVATFTDFDGNVATYSYLPAGNPHAGMLSEVVYTGAAGSEKATQTVDYTYNALGQESSIADASGTTTNSYDAFGNLIESDTPEGTFYYTFDPVTGDHTETTTGNRTDIQYGYDDQGRLTSATVNNLPGDWNTQPSASYGYDAAGNKTSESLGDGETTIYTYDDLNRLTDVLEQDGSGNTLFSEQYVLNPDGTRASVDETQLQTDGSTLTSETTWTYDADGRLTSETYTSSVSGQSYSDVFSYDLVGNRMEDVHTTPDGSGNETTTYTYNGDDELTSQTSNVSGTTTNTYDANGSLTSSVSSAGTDTYAYDVRNKMVSATVNGVTTTYVYDDAGNRVRETTGDNATTYYLTDTQNPTGYAQPIEETSSPGGWPTRIYFLGDRVFGQSDAQGDLSYLLVDGHGSTQMMTDDNGNLQSTFNYTAFGGAIGFDPSQAGTEYLFGGDGLTDVPSGLTFVGDGTRPLQGFVFTQRDFGPEGMGDPSDPTSLHQYLYADANPVSETDPSGHFGLLDTLAAAGDEAEETAEEGGVGSAAEA